MSACAFLVFTYALNRSYDDVLTCLYDVYTGVSSVALKTESDGDDVTECSDDDQPTTGMYIILTLCLVLGGFLHQRFLPVVICRYYCHC